MECTIWYVVHTWNGNYVLSRKILNLITYLNTNESLKVLGSFLTLCNVFECTNIQYKYIDLRKLWENPFVWLKYYYFAIYKK